MSAPDTSLVDSCIYLIGLSQVWVARIASSRFKLDFPLLLPPLLLFLSPAPFSLSFPLSVFLSLETVKFAEGTHSGRGPLNLQLYLPFPLQSHSSFALSLLQAAGQQTKEGLCPQEVPLFDWRGTWLPGSH